MTTHGKKFGKREKLNNKPLSAYTKESAEAYYANAAEIEAAHSKAVYAADKGYKEFIRDLDKGKKDAYRTAERQLELKEKA